MKRNLITLLCLLFLVTAHSQNKPKVVTTASMIWDMAKNIGGDHFDIQNIVPIGGDPHIYEPTPNDVKLVASAQLVLKNGLTFEGWLNDLIENSGTSAKSVRVTEGIIPIRSELHPDAVDPHAWMDVSRGFIYIKNIRDAFIELLPEQKATFEKNYEIYLAKLKALDRYIMERIASIPEQKRILITSHDAFQYFGRHYGIRLEAFLGVSTDAEAQISDLNRLNRIIKESKIPAIFVESTIDPKLLKQIAIDNNIVIGGELYADSIGEEETTASTYIDMLKHNTDTIVEALLFGGSNQEGHDGSSSSNIWLFGIMGLLSVGGFMFVVHKMNNP